MQQKTNLEAEVERDLKKLLSSFLFTCEIARIQEEEFRIKEIRK
jgi:hypothetical protein